MSTGSRLFAFLGNGCPNFWTSHLLLLCIVQLKLGSLFLVWNLQYVRSQIKTSLQKKLHYVGNEAFGIVVDQFWVRLFFCF